MYSLSYIHKESVRQREKMEDAIGVSPYLGDPKMERPGGIWIAGSHKRVALARTFGKNVAWRSRSSGRFYNGGLIR